MAGHALRVAACALLPSLAVLMFDGLEAVAGALDIDGGPRALAVAVAVFAASWLPAWPLLRPTARPVRLGLAAAAIVGAVMLVVLVRAALTHGWGALLLLVPFGALAAACGGVVGWLAGHRGAKAAP